jgi:N-acyl-D-amino-acid deacylase
MMLDVLITDGRLIDGTGAPWRYADLGIADGRVVAIGQLRGIQAHCHIEAAEKVVCPGFVDIHSHADLSLLAGRWVDMRLLQGITTEVVGQDGLSYAPASPPHLQAWRRYLAALNGDFPQVRWDWRSVAELVQRYQDRAANVVYLIPHGAVRVEVMDWEARPATVQELRAMQALVCQGLEEGAAGLSTGLTYMPCAHASTEEMVALCRPVAEAGGILSIHLRSYIDRLLPALEEAIEIGRRSGVAVQVSHLRVADPAVWGSASALLERLDRARSEGVDITFDIYPYTAGCVPLFCLLPPWAQSGGPDAILARLSDPAVRREIIGEMQSWSVDWSPFIVSHMPATSQGRWEGRSLTEASQMAGLEVHAFMLHLLCETALNVSAVADGGNEAENELMLAHPAGMLCSDGILVGGHPHPRGYGAFPRLLGRYVRQKGLLRWEEAIHKMSALPAARLNLQDRGLLRVGAAADVVIFSPLEVADQATFEDGRQPPIGIEWVLVNGRPVVDNGTYIGGNYGQALTPLHR